MTALETLSRILSKTLLIIAGLFLLAMMMLTCSNIVLRMVWVPVKGTFELMGFFGAVLTTFSLGYTQIQKGHILVDILTVRFPDRAQKAINLTGHFISMSFFILVAWQITTWANTLRNSGEVTETLRIIYYPFTYAAAFGCGVLALVFLVDFLKIILPEKRSLS
jgi:TRAP-type C4-dicarboxylate transport system permease small subunit